MGVRQINCNYCGMIYMDIGVYDNPSCIPTCIYCNQPQKGFEKPKRILPKRVIYNGRATIMFWEDGSKSVAKCRPDEPQSKLYGFLMAYFKGTCGLSNKDMKKYLNRKVED